MTSLASLIYDKDWLISAIAMVAIAIVVLVVMYQRTPGDPRTKFPAALLKAVGFALLGFCLIEPLKSCERAKPGANIFVVLADNSQGLKVRDGRSRETRGGKLAKALTDHDTKWPRELAENFDVRRYLFDVGMRTTADFSDLDFEGHSSSLITSLRNIRDRYKGRPIAGVLLFTDGNATDLPEGALQLTGLPPVYPVIVGEGETIRDIGVRNVAVTQTSFEDAPITVLADVFASGYDGEELVAQLFDDSGKQIQQQIVTPNDDDPGSALKLRFQVKPKRPGVQFYKLRVSAKDEIDQFERKEGTEARRHEGTKKDGAEKPAPASDVEQPKPLREATLLNNTNLVMVDRGKGPYRVLYVSGRPNWEYKFLSRAVVTDKQIELVGLIRMAKREPKFTWKGRLGEENNPLFRGFDKKDEDTERHDQPVLIRLNTRDHNELRDGFPKATEDLFDFHALIIDDVEAEFFTRDQMALIRRFVNERGGGLLMLGGYESFQRGGYKRTPIDDMLPVYIDRAGGRVNGDVNLKLTREGWLEPWVRLRDNETDERARLNQMAAFKVLNQASGIKPGSTVLAAVSDANNNTHPALIARSFGTGRVGALTIGDMWRWHLRRPETETEDMSKAWRQMVRWLVANVPERIAVETKRLKDQPSSPLEISVRVRDDKFDPMDNASVTVSINRPEGDPISIDLEPALNEAGVYKSTYLPRHAGAYTATVKVTDQDGKEIETADKNKVGWTSDPAAAEFETLEPNRALLERIANDSEGEVITFAKLDNFVGSLPSRTMPITEHTISPLWHTYWMFALAIMCLVGEWGLRRVKGLP